VQTLGDRSAILAAVDDHPYARFATTMATGITGVTALGAVLWWGDGPLGRLAHGLGERAQLDPLLARVLAEGRLTGLTRVNLPRRAELPAGYTRYEDWDFRWSQAPPPRQPGQDEVQPVDDADAINGLLDAAFPDSMLRPGHPMVSGWYGIWSGGSLVACAADRSTRLGTPTVGVLGGIAVHPDHRRHGWGAAVTAGLTGILRGRHELTALGVVAGNDPATRLYERLNFTGRHEVSSLLPAR
jgi:ribosomal protein S18 acetylase RimI-like enzyme